MIKAAPSLSVFYLGGLPPEQEMLRYLRSAE